MRTSSGDQTVSWLAYFMASYLSVVGARAVSVRICIIVWTSLRSMCHRCENDVPTYRSSSFWEESGRGFARNDGKADALSMEWQRPRVAKCHWAGGRLAARRVWAALETISRITEMKWERSDLLRMLRFVLLWGRSMTAPSTEAWDYVAFTLRILISALITRQIV